MDAPVDSRWALTGSILLRLKRATIFTHRWLGIPLSLMIVVWFVSGIVFVYVGMPGPLWPMMPNDPTVLDEVALAFPDLKIIAHHIGDPWNDVVVRLAARHRNYYICTSAWHPRAYPEQLMSFMKGKWHGTYGSEKVVFASDWPLLDMQKTVKAAREMNLSEEQLSSVLYANAKRLFWP